MNHSLPKLKQAIIDNTNDENLFWIGEILLADLEKETGWLFMADAPTDRIIWLYHRAFAGGPFLGFWNHRSKWWSSCTGAGSCVCPDPSHWYPAFPPLPANV